MVKHFEEVHAKVKDVTGEAFSIATGSCESINIGTLTGMALSQIKSTTIVTGTCENVNIGTFTIPGATSVAAIYFSGSSRTGQAYGQSSGTPGNNEQCSGTDGGWIKINMDGTTGYIQVYSGTVNL